MGKLSQQAKEMDLVVASVPSRALRIGGWKGELVQQDSAPVHRLLKDFEGAAHALLGRKPMMMYVRDGRLLKRLLESFSEERLIVLANMFYDYCREKRRLFDVRGFAASIEWLDHAERRSHDG